MLERYERDSIELSEKGKRKDEYLINEIDASIAACLSTRKDELIEAYNLRNGVRDHKDFAYLWEAYGIEFPAEMRHVPVLRAIFDSLVGQAINRPFKYGISCVDSESVNQIFGQYRDSVLRDMDQFWKNKIQAAAYMAQGQDAQAVRAQEYLEKLEKKYKNSNFKADIEILAKNMLDWSIQRFKLKGHTRTFADDLVTAGECLYQVKVIQIGQKPLIRNLNPINCHYTKTPDTKFIKDLDRIVVKERLPVTVIWTLYGHKMTKDDQTKFLDNWGKYIVGSDLDIIDYEYGNLEVDQEYFIQKGIEIPMIDHAYVEWKANTREEIIEPEESNVEGESAERIVKLKKRYKYKLDLYEGTRIGEDIYVNMGKSKFAVRDPDDPSNVHLSINGICYNDRNGEPYSLVLKTKAISEKIDILHYHAENLLAISGVKAIMVNLPDIPTFLGEDPMKRLMKWLGLVKQGIAIVDTSQEGAGKFNNSGDVDLSLSDSILSIFNMLEHLEATAYKVTGVPRQSVGNITQSDGKGTTEIAIQGSEIVMAPFFNTFDEIVEAFLTDVVNACRIAYSEGLQGAIILGLEGQKIFSIKKGQLELVHMNVHVNGDGTEQRDLEDVKAVAMKLIEGQMLDVELAVDMVTIKSLTQLKQKIKESIQDGKQNKEGELVQQLEEYKKQLDAATKQVESLNAKGFDIKQAELALKDRDSQVKNQLKEKEINQNAANNAEKNRLEEKRVDLEMLQLADGYSTNQEIRNN